MPSTIGKPPNGSIPVSVNGTSGEYLFDTGAWQSVVTEPEARRLGLTVREGKHFITDPSVRESRTERRSRRKSESAGCDQ